MHDIDIPQWVIDRVIGTRGAERAVYTTFGDVMPTDMVVDLLALRPCP
jgi:hypothetical protein